MNVREQGRKEERGRGIALSLSIVDTMPPVNIYIQLYQNLIILLHMYKTLNNTINYSSVFEIEYVQWTLRMSSHFISK